MSTPTNPDALICCNRCNAPIPQGCLCADCWSKAAFQKPDAPEAKPDKHSAMYQIGMALVNAKNAQVQPTPASDLVHRGPVPETFLRPATGTDTPETDKFECRFSTLFAGEDAMWVPSKIARRLERDRNALRAELAQYRKAGKWADEQLAALRGQVEEAERNCRAASYQAHQDRQQLAAANAALEEARRERDRYWGQLCDTAEALGKVSPEAAPYTVQWAKDLRAQLDAAKKAGEDDKARLDWLEREIHGGDVSLGHYPFAAPNKDRKWAIVRGYIEHYADTARAAIDAARSASPEDQP